MWREHLFEVGKAVGLVLLSVFVAVGSYVWHSTVARLEYEIAENRKYLDILAERVRNAEIAAASAASLNVGFSQRLERLEQMNYGYRGRDGAIR